MIGAIQALRSRIGEEQARTPASPIMELQKLLDSAIGRISGVMRRSGDPERELLIMMVEDYAQRAIEAARQALAES